jgi:hypothetical protein
MQHKAIESNEHNKMANFSAASLSKIGLILVLICYTTGSTGAAFSLEEEFLQLRENYVRKNLISFSR